jgi:hypothetical protein
VRLFPLRMINTFQTENSGELSRQLTMFEQNVDDAVRSVSRGALPAFTPTNRKVATYVASVGELVRVDSAAGNVAITVPVPTADNAGKCIAVSRLSASNAVTAAAASGNINGAATLTLTAAVKLFVLMSDGVSWWSTT